MAKSGAIEDVVAQNKCSRVGTDMICAKHECLREAVWLCLNGIRQTDSELGTVTE